MHCRGVRDARQRRSLRQDGDCRIDCRLQDTDWNKAAWAGDRMHREKSTETSRFQRRVFRAFSIKKGFSIRIHYGVWMEDKFCIDFSTRHIVLSGIKSVLQVWGKKSFFASLLPKNRCVFLILKWSKSGCICSVLRLPICTGFYGIVPIFALLFGRCSACYVLRLYFVSKKYACSSSTTVFNRGFYCRFLFLFCIIKDFDSVDVSTAQKMTSE